MIATFFVRCCFIGFAVCEHKDRNKKAKNETIAEFFTLMSVLHKIRFGSNIMHFVAILYPLGILYLDISKKNAKFVLLRPCIY